MKYISQWLNRKFEELRQEFGGKCKNCQSTEKLQFAHLEETGLHGWGRGKKVRYYDIINHRNAYILLCELCHKKFDKGELKL